MTYEVLTLASDATIVEAARLVVGNKISGMPFQFWEGGARCPTPGSHPSFPGRHFQPPGETGACP